MIKSDICIKYNVMCQKLDVLKQVRMLMVKNIPWLKFSLPLKEKYSSITYIYWEFMKQILLGHYSCIHLFNLVGKHYYFVHLQKTKIFINIPEYGRCFIRQQPSSKICIHSTSVSYCSFSCIKVLHLLCFHFWKVF